MVCVLRGDVLCRCDVMILGDKTHRISCRAAESLKKTRELSLSGTVCRHTHTHHQGMMFNICRAVRHDILVVRWYAHGVSWWREKKFIFFGEANLIEGGEAQAHPR